MHTEGYYLLRCTLQGMSRIFFRLSSYDGCRKYKKKWPVREMRMEVRIKEKNIIMGETKIIRESEVSPVAEGNGELEPFWNHLLSACAKYGLQLERTH